VGSSAEGVRGKGWGGGEGGQRKALFGEVALLSMMNATPIAASRARASHSERESRDLLGLQKANRRPGTGSAIWPITDERASNRIASGVLSFVFFDSRNCKGASTLMACWRVGLLARPQSCCTSTPTKMRRPMSAKEGRTRGRALKHHGAPPKQCPSKLSQPSSSLTPSKHHNTPPYSN